MKVTLEIVDILALIVQFAGAFIMYKNSPINEVPWEPTFDDSSIYQEKFRKKNKWLRQGFLILAIGISLSLISLLMKDLTSAAAIVPLIM